MEKTDNQVTPAETTLPDTPLQPGTPAAETQTEQEAPVPQEQPAQEQPSEPTRTIAATNLLELIAEAEQRGYKKGMDEACRKAVLGSGGLWSSPTPPPHEADYDAGTEILKTIRPGVWDN